MSGCGCKHSLRFWLQHSQTGKKQMKWCFFFFFFTSVMTAEPIFALRIYIKNIKIQHKSCALIKNCPSSSKYNREHTRLCFKVLIYKTYKGKQTTKHGRNDISTVHTRYYHHIAQILKWQFVLALLFSKITGKKNFWSWLKNALDCISCWIN